MDPIDAALLVVRVAFGVGMAAHGYNKVFGGGGLAGTARWFGGVGMRWPQLQARLAAFTEVGSGLSFAAGLITPLAAAGLIAVMLVAAWTVHRPNGFFVFKGEDGGWEYNGAIAVVAFAVGTIGPGKASVDHAIGWSAFDARNVDWAGAVIAGLVGVGAALLLLVVCYRPPAPAGAGPPT